MGVISRDKDQINLIYSGSSNTGKQLQAYAESLEKKILSIDIEKTMPSSTQWQELATTLGKSIDSFIDKNLVENIDDSNSMNQDDWLKVLENNPNAMKGALIVNGDKTEHIASTTKIFEYFGVDSAGLKKTMHTEKPNIEKTSSEDRFVE